MKQNDLRNQNLTLSRSITHSEEELELHTERKVLQHLKTPKKTYSPEMHAGLLSKTLLLWVDPLVRLGSKKIVEESDLPSQNHLLLTQNVKDSFSEVKAEVPTEQLPNYTRFFRNKLAIDAHEHSIFVHVFQFCKYFLLQTGSLKLVTTICSIGSPIILRFLLEVLAGGDGQTPLGFTLSVLLFLTSITYAYALQHHYWLGYKHSMTLRNALMLSIYQKLFRAASIKNNKMSGGQLINLLAVDCPVIVEFVWNPHDCWAAPLSVTVNIIVLFLFVGWSAFVPVVYILLLIPFNRYIAVKLVSLSDNILKWTDERVAQVSQVVLGMRFLKFYNAEKYFLGMIRNSRSNELKAVNSNGLVRLRMNVTWLITPAVLSLIIFTIMAFTGRDITPAIVFPVLSLMNVLQDAVSRFYTDGINLLAACVVSLKRIQSFLEMEEMEEMVVKKDPVHAVTIKQGFFTWDTEPTLKNINLQVPHSQLCTVVGSIGCGKSSLIHAILSSMKRTSGEVSVSGKVAYTSQQAWLFQGTVRENILFGEPFEEERYQQAIKCCALDRDIAQLSQGDNTMIGERGINLSGGQKQRVAIARAVYSNCDIYLFDEPLGAVDPSVASWIFHHCLLGALRNKTRILVTHQVQFLPLSDTVVVMKNGEIQKIGSYKQLTECGMDFSSIVALQSEKMKKHQKAAASGETEEDAGAHIPQLQEVNDLSNVSQEFAVNEAVSNDEERETGSVRLSVFYNYFTAGSKYLYIIITLLYLVSQGARVAADFWLAHWSDNSDKHDHSVAYYLGIYGACVAAHTILVYVRERTLLWLTMSSARHLHENMLKSVSRAPMHFFDSTPTGRILNRFSKDMKIIDLNLFYIISDIGSYGVLVLSAVAVISVLLPWLVIPLVVTAAASFTVQYFYQQTSRELKRMEAVSRSPFLSVFSQTTLGVPIIRTFGGQDAWLETRFMPAVDHNTQVGYWNFVMNRWLSLRLEIISAIVLLITALVNNFSPPAIAGLSLTYTLGVTINLNWTVFQLSELSLSMSSVERVNEYIKLESEAAPETDKDPPSSWPTDCNIVMENLALKYRDSVNLVLKGISCTIKGKEKIGIVGRTGAGKSSLVSCFFRLVEPVAGSKILIDGVNILEIGLSALRSKLCIIPQDPMLFTGTIRWSLDPGNEHDDKKIWQALEDCCIKDLIQNMTGGLSAQVAENGDNFSAGQKQLLCLARAVLRNSKILILDEASASLDLETDEIIQKTLRTNFKDCTVLTIAHRVHTIIDSDRIMVFDQGNLKEFDSPSTLLSNPDSLFSQIVESSLQSNKLG
mmetsp:Transcript_10817/g.14851  ORF Transcript_10817/g.14851 Transcript_10817/m.14851 type:complete len:1301 (-) Transcript_10817:41-3943(-)